MKPKIEVCYQVSNVDPCQKTICEHISFYEDYAVMLIAEGEEMKEISRVAVCDIVYICAYAN